MPPKAPRGPTQAKGQKRGNDEELHTTAAVNGAWTSASLTSSMTDDGEAEKQLSSGASTPLSKKAKLESADAAAGASIAPADSAAAAVGAPSPSSAAAASSAPTPCARLDLDSLSVVFSLLDMRDFLHAVRVCRHWRSARTKRTAWPAFNLNMVLQSLRDDDFDNPLRRNNPQRRDNPRRKLLVVVKSGNQTNLETLVNQSAVMAMWRQVTEIKLVHDITWVWKREKEAQASAVVMALLSQFSSLAALTLDGFTVPPKDDSVVADLFNALSSRLLMLGLFRCSRVFDSHLHRLSSLRVLILDWSPDHADSLIPLHQLEYLHITHDRAFGVMEELGFVIRWLSVHHSLRSLSLEQFDQPSEHSFLAALMSCTPHSEFTAQKLIDINLTLHPPLDPAVPCALSDLSVNGLTAPSKSWLGDLPSLTRLQCCACFRPHSGLFDVPLNRPFLLALPRLQQLRLQANPRFTDWHQLLHCTALRVVHLTQVHHDLWLLPRPVLQSLLQAWSTTLEDCSIHLNVSLDSEGDDSREFEWFQLAACQRLQRLSLQMHKGQTIPNGLAAALQELPEFRSLAVSWQGAACSSLPPNLLRVMCRSRSFSTLHLHSLSDPPDFVQSTDAGEARGLSAMLSALDPALLQPSTLSRVRVVGSTRSSSAVQSFRICMPLGQPAWQREY